MGQRTPVLFLLLLAATTSAPVFIWARTGASNKTFVVKSGVPTAAESAPELELTPLTRNITFGWPSASSKVKYAQSLVESGEVPILSSEWWATVGCSAKVTGLLHFTFFVWDANSSAVYDPIDFQIQWSCADFRYLWTWTHDLELADQKSVDFIRVVRIFSTYLPPGIYELKMFSDSANTAMGTETITVLPWDNTACASDLDCSGNGLCVGGSCQCYSYRFGGHCERGCSNLTVHSNH
eukprot:m51a1_g4234 hypothetical protein (238) ;mRNA; r:134095-135172